MDEMQILQEFFQKYHLDVKTSSYGNSWNGELSFNDGTRKHHFSANSFPSLIEAIIEEIKKKYK
jgi:hypothetical protein